MKKNHKPLDHAILTLSQMEIDLHRICIQSDDAQGALIGDCAEHRSAMLNKLRHIKHQWTMHPQPGLESQPMTIPEIMHNARHPKLVGDPEIHPEPEKPRIHSALKIYRSKVRRIEIIAWIVAIAIACGIIALAYALKGVAE